MRMIPTMPTSDTGAHKRYSYRMLQARQNRRHLRNSCLLVACDSGRVLYACPLVEQRCSSVAYVIYWSAICTTEASQTYDTQPRKRRRKTGVAFQATAAVAILRTHKMQLQWKCTQYGSRKRRRCYYCVSASDSLMTNNGALVRMCFDGLTVAERAILN